MLPFPKSHQIRTKTNRVTFDVTVLRKCGFESTWVYKMQLNTTGNNINLFCTYINWNISVWFAPLIPWRNENIFMTWYVFGVAHLQASCPYHITGSQSESNSLSPMITDNQWHLKQNWRCQNASKFHYTRNFLYIHVFRPFHNVEYPILFLHQIVCCTKEQYSYQIFLFVYIHPSENTFRF